jgi:hypothetical protein
MVPPIREKLREMIADELVPEEKKKLLRRLANCDVDDSTLTAMFTFIRPHRLGKFDDIQLYGGPAECRIKQEEAINKTGVAVATTNVISHDPESGHIKWGLNVRFLPDSTGS